MSLVRTFLWVVGTLVFAWFAATNWTPVRLVFGATEVMIRLPVLLLLAVLFGFVQGIVAGSLRRRRRARRASIAAAAALPGATPTAASALPSEAQPTIVPPGCG